MTYFGDIQEAAINEKLKLFVEALVEMIGDNDEALDAHQRTAERLEFRDGWEFSAPAYLSFYWSTGTGTPWQDRLIDKLIDAQEAEWASQYPARASLRDVLALDEDSEFRSEAEEWETAALEDEAIYIRIEAFRDHGDIKFRSCFTDEINAPYEEELEIILTEEEFLKLDSEGLEALGNRIAEAPYLGVIVKRNSGGLWHSWFGTDNGATALFSTGGHESEEAARQAVTRAMRVST